MTAALALLGLEFFRSGRIDFDLRGTFPDDDDGGTMLDDDVISVDNDVTVLEDDVTALDGGDSGRASRGGGGAGVSGTSGGAELSSCCSEFDAGSDGVAANRRAAL
eukprot:sb/3477858/